MDLHHLILLAQTAAPQTSGGGSSIMSFLPIILIVAIFYIMIWRPQQRRDREHKEMLSRVKAGDSVLTAGGIYGVVQSVKKDRVFLKVDDKCRIELAQSYIVKVLTPEEDKQEKADDNKDEKKEEKK